MNANALNLEEVSVSEKEMFQAQMQRQKVEDYVKQIVSNTEISKERQEDSKMLKEDIAQFIGDTEEPIVVELDNGEFAVIKVQKRETEALDRDALAQLSGINKDEFKSQLDFAMLVKQGKITTEMIKSCMHDKVSKSVSVRVVKNNPLEKKRKKKFK